MQTQKSSTTLLKNKNKNKIPLNNYATSHCPDRPQGKGKRGDFFHRMNLNFHHVT